MQPMLPASDSASQTTMPAPRLGPIPLMVTHLMSPHLTQEMRDNLASDAFLALPAPAQSATIVAYAQAIETAAAAAHAGGAPCRVVHEPPPLNAPTMSAP